ncbi:MAG: hypothetical protein SX243_15260 [Acidobacteriota bacterium]|nr:hypothetical protein [Acidobacteriota bacterium]
MNRLDLTMEHLLHLAEAARDLLRSRSEPVVLEHAAGTLNTALASLFWELRGKQKGQGDAPPITDEERALRSELFHAGLEGLRDKDEGVVNAALRLGLGYTYASDVEEPKESLAALERIAEDYLPPVVDSETEALLLFRLASNVQYCIWPQLEDSIPLGRLGATMDAGARSLSARSAQPEQTGKLLDRACRLCRSALVRYRNRRDVTLPTRWWQTWREQLLDEALAQNGESLRANRHSVILLLAEVADLLHLDGELRREAAALAVDQTRQHLEDLESGSLAGDGDELTEESLQVLNRILPLPELPRPSLQWLEQRLRQQLIAVAPRADAAEGIDDAQDFGEALAHTWALDDALIHVWTDLALSGHREALIEGVQELWHLADDAGSYELRKVAVEGAGIAFVLLPADDPRARELAALLLGRSEWKDLLDADNGAFLEAMASLLARVARDPAQRSRFLDQTEALNMTPATRAALDQRINRILGDQLADQLAQLEAREGGDSELLEQCLETFDQIRRLAARGSTTPSGENLERLFTQLPADHPRRAELHRLRRPARSTSGPKLLERDQQPLDTLAAAALRHRLLEAPEKPSWPLPPFFRAPWSELAGEDLVQAVSRLAAALPEDGSPPAKTVVDGALRARRTKLPFYPGWNALEVLLLTEEGTVAAAVAVEGEEHVLMLQGTSPPLHYLNHELPIVLETPEQADAYVRFFCGAVHGEEGPFRLITDTEDILPLLPPDTDWQVSTIEEHLHPLELEPQEDGFWAASAAVQYSNALFDADFKIYPTGMVEMLDDSPLTTGLPIIGEKFVDDLRRVSAPPTPLQDNELMALEARLSDAPDASPWPFPPLITILDGWEDDGVSETVTTVGELAQVLRSDHDLPREVLVEHTLRSRRLALPFYAGWSLVELLVRRGDQLVSLVVLDSEDALRLLDGTPAQLHALNKELPIQIDGAEQATAYLELFCNVTQGEGGPFRIVRTAEGLAGHGLPESADTLLETFGAQIQSPEPEQEDDGSWQSQASVLYGTYLFAAEFKIHPTGEVEMVDDEPIASELPVYAISIDGGIRRNEVEH